jgi:phage terminase large subunit-like protein
MFEGPAGLLYCVHPDEILDYNRGTHHLRLKNGSHIMGFSAEKPARLRGPQHHWAWCDEVAAWRYPEAWDMLMLGLRMGERPKAVVSTTPRPIRIIRDLVSRPDVIITKGSTYENRANLAQSFIQEIVLRYEGTYLGRQELYAELLDELPGALWKRDRFIYDPQPRNLLRIVVAVDPAVTAEAQSDETGIVVAGLGADGSFWTLDDRSLRATPDTWARVAVAAYHDWKCDRLVGETNNGGDMIESLIRTVDPNISYKKVTATRGKAIRAEPVAALYEQHRAYHVRAFSDLEDQLCTWDVTADWSPDRLDALVWAYTELMETSATEIYFAALAPPCVACGCPVRKGEERCPSCGQSQYN